MRRFFYRETIEPDIKRRNYLLKKLAYLKKYVKPVKAKQNFITTLRRELKNTDGKVIYYRYNKGLKTPVGNGSTPKKYFLLYKDNRFLESMVSCFRRNKINMKLEYKEQYIDNLNMNIKYNTVGGVFTERNTIFAKSGLLKRKKVSIAKVPLSPDPYIGIELEYASSLTLEEVTEKIIENKLYNDVRVVHDGSIRINEVYKHKIEFCILTKWTELKSTLEKLKPIIFDKPQHFSPNESCGLHIHLDARFRNHKQIYKNLICMQSVLFNLAAEYRRENRFCVPIKTIEWDDIDEYREDSHYHAISKSSYFKHHTIEVRIHQSTLSLTQIEKWITLLKRIADYENGDLTLGTFESEFALLKDKVKIEPDLIKYIEERAVS